MKVTAKSSLKIWQILGRLTCFLLLKCLNICYRAHKSLQFDPTLCQLNWVPSQHLVTLSLIIILSSRLSLNLPRGLFYWVLLNNILREFLIFLILLELMTLKYYVENTNYDFEDDCLLGSCCLHHQNDDVGGRKHLWNVDKHGTTAQDWTLN